MQSPAFDHSAPQSERADALGQLQKAHAPSSESGLVLPLSDLASIAAEVRAEFEAMEMMKSNIVPFPSHNAEQNKRGMRSVYLDDLQLSVVGDYFERPSALSYDSMRMMVEQTPILNAVIMTRVRQVGRFCRTQESGEGPGFVVRHVDRDHQATAAEQESIGLLQRFFLNCGWESNPRKRRVLRRDSFAQFMAKSVRDSLSLDSAPIETEFKRDASLGVDGFYAVDGATIRLCTEAGYQGDDEYIALQVVQGRVRNAFTRESLILEPRNPRTDVILAGYGLSEVELLVKIVTGFLNALSLNIRGFSDNSVPRGIMHLTGNYSQDDLVAFRRYWNSMVKGINNAWSVPVLVSKDQESRAEFAPIGANFDEMMFSKWMTFLTSIVCAVYGMSPDEINFESFAASKSSLSGADTAEKLADSKDKGLRPLLSYYESLFTDYIVSSFDEKYCFRWTGLDEEDEDKRHEMRKLILTVNEARAQEGYEEHPDETIGNAPLNPSLVGLYMNNVQQQQQEAQQSFGNREENGQDDEGEDGGQGAEDNQQDGQTGDDDQPSAEGGEQEQQGQKEEAEQDGEEDLGKANPNHDELGRFSSIFAPVRTSGERRGTTFSRTVLLPEHIQPMASAVADLLMQTIPVDLPNKDGHAARKGAFEAAKKVAEKMRSGGLAIQNHGSSALIELSTRGLKHARTMSGDIRAALLMYKLPSALARAVYFKSEKPDPRKADKKHIVAYHKFAVPVSQGGNLSLAILHVEEDSHGHFYYDAAISPEIGKPDIRTSGVTGHQTSQEPGPRQAYLEYIRTALEVKPGLGEIHTFFRKSFVPWLSENLSLDTMASLNFGIRDQAIYRIGDAW